MADLFLAPKAWDTVDAEMRVDLFVSWKSFVVHRDHVDIMFARLREILSEFIAHRARTSTKWRKFIIKKKNALHEIFLPSFHT
jgi:hypothetical protein